MNVFFRMEVCRGIIGVLALGVMFMGAAKRPAADGLPPIEQSPAFEEFLKKPDTNIAKGICLLNYFRDNASAVQYDGVDYPIQVAYPIGLAYILTNYHNEEPKQWIKKYCYRSLHNNNIMYLKFPNGSMRPARDVFLEKLDELDRALEKRSVPLS